MKLSWKHTQEKESDWGSKTVTEQLEKSTADVRVLKQRHRNTTQGWGFLSFLFSQNTADRGHRLLPKPALKTIAVNIKGGTNNCFSPLFG